MASAILCFAYGRNAVLLDTNTRRIARRLTGNDNVRSWEIRLELFQRSGRTGPDTEWNYALLDLGALVCTANAPRCGECPVQRQCPKGRLSVEPGAGRLRATVGNSPQG